MHECNVTSIYLLIIFIIYRYLVDSKKHNYLHIIYDNVHYFKWFSIVNKLKYHNNFKIIVNKKIYKDFIKNKLLHIGIRENINKLLFIIIHDNLLKIQFMKYIRIVKYEKKLLFLKIKLKDISYDYDRDIIKLTNFIDKNRLLFLKLYEILRKIQFSNNMNMNINDNNNIGSVVHNIIKKNFNNFISKKDFELLSIIYNSQYLSYLDIISNEISINLLPHLLYDIISKDSCISYEEILDKLLKEILDIFLQYITKNKEYSNINTFTVYAENILSKYHNRVLSSDGKFYYKNISTNNRYCYFCSN